MCILRRGNSRSKMQLRISLEVSILLMLIKCLSRSFNPLLIFFIVRVRKRHILSPCVVVLGIVVLVYFYCGYEVFVPIV